MEEFIKELKNFTTDELILIEKDQKDLYSVEEMAAIREELSSRLKTSGFETLDDLVKYESSSSEKKRQMLAEESEKKEINENKNSNLERNIAIEEILNEEKRKSRIGYADRVNELRSKGMEGYYEYKTLSLNDDEGGSLKVEEVNRMLNAYALYGWRLVSAYSNEIGKDTTSGGILGFTAGTNSTIDQHILILERFIRF